MKNRKKALIQFGIWMRNGTAFCIAWFLLIILAVCHIFHYETISINTLTKIVCFTIGGVFIFCVVFTRLFIKKWSFMARLTCFMLSISLYECAGFYWIGIFAGKGTITQWLVFVGILFILYFVSTAVYQRHSIKQGILYTQALQKYQEQRRTADEG